MTEAESIIIKRFSRQQYLAYFIRKILYYKYLNHLRDGESEISSFAVKNAAFRHFSESKYSRIRHLGRRINIADVFNLVTGLLKFLMGALNPCKEHKFRPYMEHFFLEGVNILKNVPQTLGEKAAGVLQEIIEGQVIEFLPKENEVDKVISFVANIEKGATKLFRRRLTRCFLHIPCCCLNR